MRFNLKSPCRDCPFIKGSRTNITLAKGRLEGIVEGLKKDESFICHKTLQSPKTVQEHCAGAMLYLEREDRPNQVMRIAERLGMYDRYRLVQTDRLIEPMEGSD
jgi:hypothetical protein